MLLSQTSCTDTNIKALIASKCIREYYGWIAACDQIIPNVTSSNIRMTCITNIATPVINNATVSALRIDTLNERITDEIDSQTP